MKGFGFIYLILCCYISKSQNLVPNPSFKNYILCPTNSCNVETYSAFWTAVSVISSTDYFNPCSPSCKLPTQFAITGNFSLYPNPNNGSFKIQFEELIDLEAPINLIISNLMGQIIYEKLLVNNSYDVQSGNLSQGVYTVSLIQNHNVLGQRKLIIE